MLLNANSTGLAGSHLENELYIIGVSRKANCLQIP